MADHSDRTISEYLDEVGSANPTPGGGSVAATAAALGTALGEMVANVTISSGRSPENESALSTAAETLSFCRVRLAGLATDDERAYANYRCALSLPRYTESEKAVRSAELQNCTLKAAEIPLSAIQECDRSLAAMEACATFGSHYAIADIAVGTELLGAAAHGLARLVSVNTALLRDRTEAARLQEELSNLLARIESSAELIKSTVDSRDASVDN